MPSLDAKHVVLVDCWYTSYNETCPPPVRWPLAALAIALNFLKANAKSTTISLQKWAPLEPKFGKLNVDVAYFVDVGVGATATVIRDEKGTFLAGQCRRISMAGDAITWGATAKRDGLLFANNMGFHRVEAESDSLEVMNFCSGQNTWWEPAATIFVECLDIGESIGKANFMHCFRSANQVRMC